MRNTVNHLNKKNYDVFYLNAILFTFVLTLFISGCGSDSNTSSGPSTEDVYIKGAFSMTGAVYSAPSLTAAPSAGPAKAIIQASSRIILIDYKNKKVLARVSPDPTGKFVFGGSYKNLILSVAVENTVHEIFLGAVPVDFPKGKTIQVSKTYGGARDFDEYAEIASNLIKNKGLTDRFTLKEAGAPELWDFMERTRTAVNSYLTSTPGVTLQNVLTDSRTASSATVSEVLKRMPAGALDRFEITSNSPQKKGDPVTLTVTAKDYLNNTLVSYVGNGSLAITGETGIVKWSGNGVANVLGNSGVYSLVTFVNGVASIYVSNTAADTNKKITVTDASLNKTGATQVSWVDTTLHHLDVTMTQTEQTAGSPINVTVTAKDMLDNILTSFTSSVAITDTTGTVSPAISGAFTGGVWNGTVYITKTSAASLITFTNADSKVSVQSAAIKINPAPASKLTLYKQPSLENIAGAVFATAPITALCDTYENIVTTDNTTNIVVSASGGSGALLGTTTVKSTGGMASFSNLSYRQAEQIKLNFKAGTLATVESQIITISPAALDHFSIISNTPQMAGKSIELRVTAQDAYNNTISGYASSGDMKIENSAGTITWTGTGVSSGFGQNAMYSADAFTNGVMVAGIANNLAETSKKITITDSATKKTGSATLSWLIGTLDHFEFALIPVNQVAGTAFSITVIACDALNNKITNFTQAVNLSDTTGTISPAMTGAFTSGSWTGTVTVKKSAQDIALSADVAGKTGKSNLIKTTPGAVAKLIITGQPPVAAIAGETFTPFTVAVADSYGNVLESDNSTHIIMTKSSANGGTLSGVLSQRVVNGVATFKDISYSKAENLLLTFSSGTLRAVDSDYVTVSPAAASKLVISSVPPSSVTAGAAMFPAINICDAFDNVITSDNQTQLTVTTGIGSSTLEGVLTKTAIKGHVDFSNLVYKKAETVTLKFYASSNLSPVESAIITVNAQAAYKLSIIQQPPESAFTGVVFTRQPKVAIIDMYGNILTGSSSAITATPGSSASGILGGTRTRNAVNGIATFNDLTYNRQETISLVFTSSGVADAESSNVKVESGFDHFNFTFPSGASQQSGSAIGVTITAKDINNNTLTGYNGTGNFTLTGASGTITWTGTGLTPNGANCSYASSTFTNGETTINITDTLADSGVLLKATDSYTSKYSSTTLTWLTGSLDKFAISGITASQTAGGAITITVTARDSRGNIISNYGESVNIWDSTGTVSPTVIGPLSSGTWTGQIAVAKAQNNVTLTVTNEVVLPASPKSGTSNKFNVAAGAASKLTVTTQPSAAAVAGVDFAQQPAVAVTDAYGNVITSDNSTIVTAARGSFGTGTLTGELSRKVVNGVATFTGLSYRKAELMNIAFSAGQYASAETQNTTISNAALDNFYVTAPSTTQTAGVPFSLTINARDLYGNTVKSYTNVAVLSSSAGAFTYPSRAFVSGVWSGFVTMNKAQSNISITSNDGTPVVMANYITIGANIAAKLTIIQQPAAVQYMNVTILPEPMVALMDTYDNIISSDSTTNVTATRSSSGKSVLSGTTTQKLSSGIATFNDLVYDTTEANIKIKFTSGSFSAETGAMTFN